MSYLHKTMWEDMQVTHSDFNLNKHTQHNHDTRLPINNASFFKYYF